MGGEMSALWGAVDQWLEDRAKRLTPRGLFDTRLQRASWQARIATGMTRAERERELER